MRGRASRRHLLALALAVVSPCFLLGVGLAGVLGLRTREEVRLEAQAGTVVDGYARPEGVAAYVRAELAEHPRAVVVLGDSLAHADLDRLGLAQALGLGPEQVVRFSMPNSTGAHWYAALDNHVFGAGHRPRAIVVVAALRSMLETDPPSEAIRANLDALLDGDDPVVEARVGSVGGSFVDAVRVRRVIARRLLLDAPRSAVVGWFGAPDHEDWLAWGSQRVDRASRRVFDRRELSQAVHRSVLTLAPDPRVLANLDPEALPTPDGSFLPDLLQLAAEHGAKVALVRPPLSPLLPVAMRDPVRPGTVEAVDALTRRAGARFLDFSDLAVGMNRYDDAAHLDPAGAKRFTSALGQRLRAIGLLRESWSEAPFPFGALARQRPRFAQQPSPWSVSPVPGPAKTMSWRTPGFTPTLDALVGAGGRAPSWCVPLVAMAGGSPLPVRPCAELVSDDAPGACFDGQELLARPLDATVTIDPARRCGDALWLLPGDRVTLDVPGGGPCCLTVRAVGATPPDLEVTVGDGRSETRRVVAEDLSLVVAVGAQGPYEEVEIENRSAEWPVLLLGADGPR